MLNLGSAHVIILQKGWQALAGVITALLVTHFLSLEEQGFYYAIGGLLSGCLLLDLGLSSLLVQIAARMSSGIELDVKGGLTPSENGHSAFLALVGWSRRWYARIAALSLALMPLGFLYFSSSETSPGSIDWHWPWVMAVICVALSLPAYPLVSIIEGMGRVSEAYWVRLGQYVLGAALAWICLLGGQGLFAPAMAPLAIAVVVYCWAGARYRNFFASSNQVDETEFAWRSEVWPLQRRVALSWLANYLLLSSPTLIVFYFGDAADAGRLGLSIVVSNLIGSMCASWLVAKVPRITQLIAQGSGLESRKVFLKELGRAFLLLAISFIAVLCLVMFASDNALAKRVLHPEALLILCGVFLIFHGVAMLSLYFRAKGEELLAVPAFGATLFGVVMSLVIVKGHGVVGVLVAFLVAYGLLVLPAMYFSWCRIHER
jgi:hypothetical protein